MVSMVFILVKFHNNFSQGETFSIYPQEFFQLCGSVEGVQESSKLYPVKTPNQWKQKIHQQLPTLTKIHDVDWENTLVLEYDDVLFKESQGSTTNQTKQQLQSGKWVTASLIWLSLL